METGAAGAGAADAFGANLMNKTTDSTKVLFPVDMDKLRTAIEEVDKETVNADEVLKKSNVFAKDFKEQQRKSLIDASIDARAERAKVNFVELKIHYEKMHPTKEIHNETDEKDAHGKPVI